jgi:hypothetical protein
MHLQTNIYKYLVWRRRSLYAVLLPCVVVFAEVRKVHQNCPMCSQTK